MFESKIKQDIELGINLFSYNPDSQRLEFKYTDEIKTQIEKVYLKNFPNLNLNASTPQGQQITTLTQSFNACIDYLEACGTSFFLGGSGIFLDYWAWNIFRLKRKQGTPSSALIEITGVANTEIPADFLISDGTQDYIISKPSKIGTNGSLEIIFYATEINDHVALENKITQIVTIVDGVERVENKTQATKGTKKETDTQLWLRALKYGSTALSGSFRSILANVNAVSGVSRVSGYENITDVEKTIKGTTIPSHCFGIVVEGGKDLDIANAILYSKGTGSGMVGDAEVEIWDNKEKYIYSFFRPSYIAMKVKIIVAALHNPPEDFAEIVKENIVDYFNNVDFGYLITQPNLIQESYNKFQNKTFIKDLMFSKKNENLGYNSIQLQFTEAPTISFNDIEILAQD